MQPKELLRFQLTTSHNLTAALLADMQDAPLTSPTPNGGNHPWWVAGHLAYSESNLTTHILLGPTNPLIEWKELFGAGSQPAASGDDYPPYAEILAKWDEIHANTLSILDSLTDEDLSKPSANPPEGREEFFGTYGKVFSVAVLHPAMHRGQVADARRALGRDLLMS